MFLKKPKKPKKIEQLAGYIVDGLLYLTERAIRWIYGKTLDMILNHFNVDVNNIPLRRKRWINFWNAVETAAIVIAFICFLNDAYWALIISLAVISISFYIIYKEAQRYQNI